MRNIETPLLPVTPRVLDEVHLHASMIRLLTLDIEGIATPALSYHDHSTIDDSANMYPHKPTNQMLQATIKFSLLGLPGLGIYSHDSVYQVCGTESTSIQPINHMIRHCNH